MRVGGSTNIIILVQKKGKNVPFAWQPRPLTPLKREKKALQQLFGGLYYLLYPL